MPPKKAKNATPTDSIPSFPAPPVQVPTKEADGARTPEKSPSKIATGLTQAQKQALMDNLQLEITERARRLRAQYAFQAQELRRRYQMRIARVPRYLLKCNIQELLTQHMEKANAKPLPPVPVSRDNEQSQPEQAKVGKPVIEERRSLKRQSDQISADEDKENVPSQDLANPKKRSKPTVAANSKASRTVSRKAAPASTVLSPKSHNSRSFPRSPFKTFGLSERTQQTARPASPVKPAAAADTSSRATSRQTTKRKAGAGGQENGRSSEASNTSASTTIIGKATARVKAAVKRPAALKSAAAAAKTKKAPAAQKKENVAPAAPVGGGRTLRKRG